MKFKKGDRIVLKVPKTVHGLFLEGTTGEITKVCKTFVKFKPDIVEYDKTDGWVDRTYDSYTLALDEIELDPIYDTPLMKALR